ncbi:hypothetical protein [Persephonella sp.]
MDKRKIIGAVLVVSSLFFFFLPPADLPFFDTEGEEYFKESTKKAVLTYASVRGINAVISVLKDSQLEIAPAGIGASIAVGQVLDPIDDLIERFSLLVLVSIVSLGVQKVLLVLGKTVFFKILGTGVFLVGLYLLTNRQFMFTAGVKIILIALVVRLLLPVSALVNGGIYELVFKEKVEQAEKELSDVFSTIKGKEDFQAENSSFLDKLKGIKYEEIKEKVLFLKEKSSQIVNGIIILSVAFVFQTILIPVFLLWVFYRLTLWIITGFSPSGLQKRLL